MIHQVTTLPKKPRHEQHWKFWDQQTPDQPKYETIGFDPHKWDLHQKHAFLNALEDFINTSPTNMTPKDLIRAVHRERKLKKQNQNNFRNGGRPNKVKTLSKEMIRTLDRVWNWKESFEVTRKLIIKIQECSRPTELKIRNNIEEELDIEFKKSFFQYDKQDIVDLLKKMSDKAHQKYYEESEKFQE